jgi:cytochrome c-type biogenesis protein CcmF
MLLWVLILVLFGALLAWRGEAMPKRLLATVLAVQVQHRDRLSRPSSLLTSNPFARVIPAAVRGQGAEPALAGSLVSRSIRRCSIWAMSAFRSPSPSPSPRSLMGASIAAWARWVRPWTLAGLDAS